MMSEARHRRHAFLARLLALGLCACSEDDATTGGNGGASGNAGNASGGSAPSGGSANEAGSGSGGRAGAGANGGGGNDSGGGGTSAGSGSAGMNAGGGSAGMNAGGGSGSGAGNGGMPGDPLLPEANAPFDYQIGGDYPPPSGVLVVSRDRESAPAPNVYNICYVNGFQAQPNEESFWLDDHPDLVLRDSAGEPVIDPDWDELLLDTSTPEKRDGLAEIVGSWIAECGDDGFDAVEIDNLDSYSRSQGLLSQENNVAFMRMLADTAHADGLAIAQKNSTELLERVPEMSTDFAVAEECNRWDECEDYRSVYGDRVFVIEYRQQDFEQGCSDYPGLSIVLRDLDVSTPGSASYVFHGC
jgi:hypothetical protein